MSSPPFPYRFPIKRVLVVVYSAAKTVRSRPRSFATVSCLFHLRGGYCSRVGLCTGRIFLCLARAKAWFRELPRLGGAPASPSDRCRISQRWTGLGSSPTFPRNRSKSALTLIVLQKSKIAGRPIFRQKTKRAAIAGSYRLSLVTEVAGEFIVTR